MVHYYKIHDFYGVKMRDKNYNAIPIIGDEYYHLHKKNPQLPTFTYSIKALFNNVAGLVNCNMHGSTCYQYLWYYVKMRP